MEEATNTLIQEIYEDIMSYQEEEEEGKSLAYWNMQSRDPLYPPELNNVFITAGSDREILGILERYTQENIQEEGFLRQLIREYFGTEIGNYIEDPILQEPMTGEVVLEMIFEDYSLKYEFKWESYSRIIVSNENPLILETYPLLRSVEENATTRTKYWVYNSPPSKSLEGIFFPARTPEGALLKMDSYLDYNLISNLGGFSTSPEIREREIVEDLHTSQEIELSSFDTLKIVS